MEKSDVSFSGINPKTKTSLSPRRFELPSRVNWSRGYTFGSGKRSVLLNEHSRNSPSPAAYKISSIFDRVPNGPVLRGQANYLTSFKRVSNLPGPGTYDPYSPLGKEAPKYSFKNRLINNLRTKSPGPSDYFPNFKTTQTNKFAEISFGIRHNSNKSRTNKNLSPGPGDYEIPDTFTNTFVNFYVPK